LLNRLLSLRLPPWCSLAFWRPARLARGEVLPLPHGGRREVLIDVLSYTLFAVLASMVLAWLLLVQWLGLAPNAYVFGPAAAIPALLAPTTMWRVFRLTHALSHAQQALRRMADTDGLTQLDNRRRFVARFDAALAHAAAQGTPQCLMIFDLDDFKRVNDQHGHPAGDALLQAVAALLRERQRPGDPVARWGGEEFIIGLNDCPLPVARAHAEQLCQALSQLQLPLAPEGPVLHTSGSFGVAAWAGSGDTLDALIKRADDAMYAAKRGGRRRVEVAAAPGSP
jgi:diguanylate cyclase (GGDEF)-like protein